MIDFIHKELTLICLLGLSLFGLSFAPTQAIAAPSGTQPVDVLQKICSKKPNATACKDKNPNPGPNNNPLFGSNGIITEVVNIISILVGIAAVIMIIMAGLKFTTSGSNPQEVTAAREMIIYAAVGLIVVALAQVFVHFIINRVIS